MVPIPDYLAHISIHDKSKDNLTTFSLRCPCGNNTFFFYENVLTPEEKKEIRPYYDALHYLYGRDGYGSRMTVDENGTRHLWKLLNRDGSEKEEVFLPPKPFYAGVTVIKVKCASCGQEHILFNSRIHGYDGMTSEKEPDVLAYQPLFKQKGRQSSRIIIKIKNDPSYEEFNSQPGLAFDEQQYSNSFSWIVIYGIDGGGKKKKLFDCETA